jgi:hypothetical protein
MKEKTTKGIDMDHTPNFNTFPLSDTAKKVPDSGVTIPSEDETDEVKDWVDFKEM